MNQGDYVRYEASLFRVLRLRGNEALIVRDSDLQDTRVIEVRRFKEHSDRCIDKYDGPVWVEKVESEFVKETGRY